MRDEEIRNRLAECCAICQRECVGRQNARPATPGKQATAGYAQHAAEPMQLGLGYCLLARSIAEVRYCSVATLLSALTDFTRADDLDSVADKAPNTYTLLCNAF